MRPHLFLWLSFIMACAVFIASCSQSGAVIPSGAEESPNFSQTIERQAIILYAHGRYLRAWPEISALGTSQFAEHPIYPTNLGYYATDFAPQVNADGRFLIIPGIDREVGASGSADDATSWLLNLRTGATTEIEHRPIFAVWSPDGQQFAYVKDETLYVQQLDSLGRGNEVFTELGLGNLFVKWDPNNQQIAIFSNQIGESVDGNYPPITSTLWVVSSERQQMMGNFYIPPIEHTHQAMQWSDDGTALFLAMTWPNYVIPLHGEPIALAEGITILAWLPQNRLLVKEANGSLLIVDAHSQERIVQVSEENRQITSWAISPSGRYLAFAYEQTSDTPIEIYLFDVERDETSVWGTVPTTIVSSLIWLPESDGLLIDDGNPATPIWGIGLESRGLVEVILANGTLLHVLPRHNLP